MALYKDLVNSVLRKLREPQVGSVAENTISQLVGAFVNDARKEVQGAWQWSQLQDTFTGQFTLVNGGSVRWKDCVCAISGVAPLDGSRVWQDNTNGTFLVRLDDPGTEQLLTQTQLTARDSFVTLKQMSNQGTKQIPSQFYITNNSSGVATGTSIKVINTLGAVDKTYNFTVAIKNSQNDLVNDTDNMLIPTQPVILRAYLYCLYERGEELGETLTLTAGKADEALADAIAVDTINQAPLQFISE